jgi:aquaporin Z
MNPARTLGPLLLVGGSPDWWVFVFGPLLGAVIAVWLTWLIHGGPNAQEAEKSHG